MTFRRWIYHATEEPKIINSDEFESYESEGWADSPARFLNLEDVGIDKEKTDAGDEQETAKAQQALDAVEGVVQSINGALNLELMNKEELEDYAREHFGVELDRRKRIKTLLKQVKELAGVE